jgi:hypothetical protein
MANEIDFWQARKDFLVEPVIADGQPFAQGGIPEVIHSGGARVLLSKKRSRKCHCQVIYPDYL